MTVDLLKEGGEIRGNAIRLGFGRSSLQLHKLDVDRPVVPTDNDRYAKLATLHAPAWMYSTQGWHGLGEI